MSEKISEQIVALERYFGDEAKDFARRCFSFNYEGRYSNSVKFQLRAETNNDIVTVAEFTVHDPEE